MSTQHSPEPHSVAMRRLLNFVSVYDRVFQARLMDDLDMQGFLAENMPKIKKKMGDEVYAMAMATSHRIPYLDLNGIKVDHAKMVTFCLPGQIPGCYYAAVTLVGSSVVIATDKPTQPDIRSRLRSLVRQPFTIQLVTSPIEQLAQIAEDAQVAMLASDERELTFPLPEATASGRLPDMEYIRRIKNVLVEWETAISNTQPLPKVDLEG